MLSLRLARLLVVALLALLSVSPTFAAAPKITVIPIHHQLTFEDCDGLTIHFTNDGTVTVKEFTDQQDNLVREIDNLSLHGSYTNVAIGFSLRWLVVGPDKLTFHKDGSLMVASMGLSQSITVPHYGVVIANAGRVVVQISADGTEEVIFQAGPHDGDVFPTICPYLAGKSSAA